MTRRVYAVRYAHREAVRSEHFYDPSPPDLAAFPRARFWVQDAELAFWTGRYAGRGAIGHTVEPPDILELVRLNFERRVRFVDGDEQMAPGITLHRVGGHAPGLQVVLTGLVVEITAAPAPASQHSL